jgi:hypothetical protein
MLFQPGNPWITRTLPEGSEPQEPIKAGHVEREEGERLLWIIRFIPKGEGFPADTILGAEKKDLVALCGHHRKEPVVAYHAERRKNPDHRAQKGAERVWKVKLAKG